MHQTLQKPRKGIVGLLLILLVVLGVICIHQTYLTISAVQQPKTFAPAVPTYTNHSTARTPQSVLPRMARPMRIQPVSVNSRPFARQPITSAKSKGIFATSDAQVRTIGSGAGSMLGRDSGSSFSNGRGIVYTNASVTMPMFAMTSTSTMATHATESFAKSGPRRIQSNGDGSYDGEIKIEAGYTYYWDEASETWISTMPVGTTKTEGGITYMWNGTSWEVVTGTDPLAPAPIGEISWLMLIASVALYAIYKERKRVRAFPQIL